MSQKIILFLWRCITILNIWRISMARPIKETPILTGDDAERFVNNMLSVEKLSKEVRVANKKRLMADYEAARKRITICI